MFNRLQEDLPTFSLSLSLLSIAPDWHSVRYVQRLGKFLAKQTKPSSRTFSQAQNRPTKSDSQQQVLVKTTTKHFQNGWTQKGYL